MITFVIAAYNAERTIVQCVASIEAWNHPEAHVLVVDDGSTDGTSACLEERFGNPSWLRVIRVPNGGVAAARRLGVSSASTPFVFFVDADDEVPASVVGQLIGLSAGGWDIVFGDTVEFDQESGLRVLRSNHTEEGTVTAHAYYTGCFLQKENALWGKLIRRELLLKTHDIRENIGEDHYVFVQLLLLAPSILYTGKVHYIYRVHSAGLTGRLDYKMRFDYLSARVQITHLVSREVRWPNVVRSYLDLNLHLIALVLRNGPNLRTRIACRDLASATLHLLVSRPTAASGPRQATKVFVLWVWSRLF